jgi:hypothetical protein
MWDLGWTKCHGDRFFLEYFRFSLSVSFHHSTGAPLIGKIKKNTNHLSLHLHYSVAQKALRLRPSVASAAGLFTTKTKEINAKP